MENIPEGPVYRATRVSNGTRIFIDMPVKASLAVHGSMFAYSGYILYYTLKGMHQINKEKLSA